ncbi:FAD-dependent oxidoreductase [Arthrobacter sp. R4-81]
MSRRTYDLAVVGSGGAGLVAACAAADRGLSVIVLESTDFLGGTTALSGGQMWIPCSPAMIREGFSDSADAAMAYLQRVTLGVSPAASLRSFLENAPKFVTYLEDELNIPVVNIDRPDYHPDWAGAAMGRTVEPLPVPAQDLGAWKERTRTSPTRRPLTGPETRTGIDNVLVAEREASDVRTQGSGLVAGLVRAALRRGVELRTLARVTSVSRLAGDFVLGMEEGEIVAQNVVLASGGFARSADLRKDFLPPVEIVPTAAPGSLGDSLRLGTALGGRLRGMSEAWWTAAASIEGETIDGVSLHRNVVRELAFPGSILVNAAGVRFVNEASSYNDLGKSFYTFDAAGHRFPNQPAWLIFDANFRSTRSIAGIGPSAPAPKEFIEADGLSSLARNCGIDAAALHLTVAENNNSARTGADRRFSRGANAHDRFNGDQAHQPNPCLGPITEPPFFAVPITLGANGTKGGLVTDEFSRVLDHRGEPIRGLFAAGESAAALMGPGYAGSGASLGPALTSAFTLAVKLSPPAPESMGSHAGMMTRTERAGQ